MKKILLFLSLVFLCSFCFSQDAALPFWEEIQAFKKLDSADAPPQNAILLVGSSSFRMWTSVQQAFPQHAIINRGFGGSSLPHVIEYADEIIFPYKPKQVLIYCGENDLAASDTVSVQTVFSRFQQLFALIRKALPNTSILFVSIKPSPSRSHLMPKIVAANALIKAYLQQQRNAQYVDVYHAMLTPEGQPREELFFEDRLHMNEKGYAIWKNIFLPYLKK